MATTSKLEMSLDEIIKANKNREAIAGGKAVGQQQMRKKIGGPPGVRRGQIAKKQQLIGVQQNGRNNGIRKRIGGGRPVIVKIVGQNRFGGNIRRKPMGGGRIGGPARNIVVQNRAVVSATRNLVQKLVKKALNQQSNLGTVTVRPVSNMGIGGGVLRRGIRRVPLGRRVLPRTTVILNKLSPRSRVIGRRPRIIAVPQQQPTVLVQRVRARGRRPIRFAQTSSAVVQTVLPQKFAPRRRFNNAAAVQYVQQQQPQQQQPTLVVQQQPRRPLAQRNIPFQAVSVREHINALRRAAALQQLQAQFDNQSPQQLQRRRPRPQQQQQRQQFVVQQVRQQPRQMFRQQQPQQIIVTQQQQLRRLRGRSGPQPQQQFVVQPQFGGAGRQGGGRPQRRRQQQNFMVDPMFEPANFLQRILAGTYLQYQ